MPPPPPALHCRTALRTAHSALALRAIAIRLMSQLFDSFRAIGFVCDGVPASAQQRGTETFVAVAVGRSYQMFSCERLNLLFASPILRQRIRALAQQGDLTFAASGPDVFVYRRGKQETVYRDADAVGRVALLLVLGGHLLSFRRGGQATVWNIAEGTLWRSFQVSDALGEPTACAHPPTYLNKVLVGGSTGAMELWNVRTQKAIYKFKGWGSRIVALEPSPAVSGLPCLPALIPAIVELVFARWMWLRLGWRMVA